MVARRGVPVAKHCGKDSAGLSEFVNCEEIFFDV